MLLFAISPFTERLQQTPFCFVSFDETQIRKMPKLPLGTKSADPQAYVLQAPDTRCRSNCQKAVSYPNYYLSSNNMAKPIQPNIPSHHLPKSLHKLKNSESILFFRSQICHKHPHPIFFLNVNPFFFLIWFNTKKNQSKSQTDTPKKTPIHTRGCEHPHSPEIPKIQKITPKWAGPIFYFILFFYDLN